MSRLLPHPILTPTLIVIWLLLVNSIAPGQVILGLLLGWAIPVLTIGFWPEAVYIYKPFTLLRYIGVLLFDIIVANFTVARLILGNPNRLTPTFVVVPLDLNSEVAISFLANSITLTPGTLSAQLSPDRKGLLVHALNETDADALVASIKQRYESPLKKVFEKC